MSDAVAVGNGEAVTEGVELGSGVAEAAGSAVGDALVGEGRRDGEHEPTSRERVKNRARCQAEDDLTLIWPEEQPQWLAGRPNRAERPAGAYH